MRKAIAIVVICCLTLVLWINIALAQTAPTIMLEQDRELENGGRVQPLTAENRANLGDPLFNLVLKDRADVVNLGELETLIKGDNGQEQVFVVSETIEDPSPRRGNRPASRRAIVTFSGENQGQRLAQNVMLSVFFNSEDFPDVQSIEALGWDRQRGRYNYYKLDQQGTLGRRSWKFRNSSIQADLLEPAQRTGTCLQCHVNGAPVMKELALPWNNWHSGSDEADYLKSSWPVGRNPRISKALKRAEELETDVIVPAINRFNTVRIEESLAHDQSGNLLLDAEGRQQVIDSQRLLRPLFVTTEVNLISSNQQVGSLHPFSSFSTPGPFSAVAIPNSFFLNANLISGDNPSVKQGLNITESLKFNDIAQVKPDEYRQLVNESGVKLGDSPGDTNFAWFVPEPSHVDNNMIEQLITQGIVTPEFVAAVMAIDLETPILSSAREELLQFVPPQFSFQPLESGTNPFELKRHPDDLTQQVIAALENKNPPKDSPAGQFLEILKSDEPLEILGERVEAYRSRIDQNLNQLGPEARQAELKRLYDLAIARRQAVKQDRVLAALDEFGLLFPLP